MEPLEAFFRYYSWFNYFWWQSASVQFNRLREEARRRGDYDNDTAWQGYRTALVRQFNSSYSADENDLAAWHNLLRHIGITDPPMTVVECKILIEGKFINLVDLVDARTDSNRVIRHFANEVELSVYTLSRGKVFPRKHIEAGSLLEYLLRNIVNPNPDRHDPTQSPKKGKGKKRHYKRR
ncbi:hypothetical protein Agabi119p4_2252 [Agaricus bisporus var. burnettii]|uniref:Uncharacterized protein n=1 Tax=Agaricus bisporus var. burnettii TaxID=192524 RepID=A0A8H7F8R6_AGABI|nr:hypothetical protein Agabi119p4_2252 [Agaricus bisporus var. burnettii]